METLTLKVMFGIGDITKQWDISGRKIILWIAKIEDAKLGITDQHDKEHVYIFKKGAKIEQWLENKMLMMKYDGLKRIEYSSKSHKIK